MSKKLPTDCFAIYVAMQGERSYQAIADRFGVSKRTVQKLADREHWTERLAEIDHDIQQKMDKKLGETLGEIRERHLKMARAIGNRAVRGLAEYALTSAMESVKAAEISIKLERLIAGEASDRTALTVEQVTKQEIDRLLKFGNEPVEDGEDPDDEW